MSTTKRSGPKGTISGPSSDSRKKIFQDRRPLVEGNPKIRDPQREAFLALEKTVAEVINEREFGIVLPVGCGKSGCIALAPFAVQANRALVVAPGLKIAEQLARDLDPTNPAMFYIKTGSLGRPFPEPVEIRGDISNRSDLEQADIVITNIQQLQGVKNRWVSVLPNDFFDLILFDEGHHNVAATWTLLRNAFPLARIVSFSATPLRADGQKMAGRIIYSYSVFRAMEAGYIKQLKGVVLNPRTLRYVRREDQREVEVSLDEVIRLGEEDADFRRSIVTSEETLGTLVDASLRELLRLRDSTGDGKHKIIASALNFEHCAQITEAYRARGYRAEYVHSREESTQANQRVFRKLEGHELDVIVQVRMLGEGFDHRYLSIAACFSIFSNLSPFVQFVGRIMRVVVQNDPGNAQNQGAVVFHAGGNVARRWSDFREYSDADQKFFDLLLPVEALPFDERDEIEIRPSTQRKEISIEVRAQEGVTLQEIQLIQRDEEAMAAIKVLASRGLSPEAVRRMMELEPMPTTKSRARRAKQLGLDQRVQNDAGRLLRERQISAEGHNLDRKGLGRSNFVVVKSAIDKRINDLVSKKTGQRAQLSREELDRIESALPEIIAAVIQEVFDA